MPVGWNCGDSLINNQIVIRLQKYILFFYPFFSCWISGWLFPRCSVWMPLLWFTQIMKSSNYWRPFFTLITTIIIFITMWICPGAVLLTRGHISPKFRIFPTVPPWVLLPPGLLVQRMQFPLKKPRFIPYTHAKLHLKCKGIIFLK